MSLSAMVKLLDGETLEFPQTFVDPENWNEDFDLAKASNSRQYNVFIDEVTGLFQPREVTLVDGVEQTDTTPAVAPVTALAGDAFRARSVFRGVDADGVEHIIAATQIARVTLVSK